MSLARIMGSECNPSKRHYDISMSKRTRKPLNLDEANQNPTKMGSPEKEIPPEGVVDQVEDSFPTKDGEGEESNPKSLKLKQLIINGNEKAKVKLDEEHRGRSSLGQHFTQEEKQLQLVKKQQQDGVQGVNLKGMVSRYAKVLGHLIKVKRDHPRKKKLLRLTM